eukprot:1038279-Pelagomonas_calceolata.AAC.1
MPPRILQNLFRRIDKFLSIDVNPDPVPISSIRSLADVQKWRVFSDATFGGASRGSLELRSADQVSLAFVLDLSKSSPVCGSSHTQSTHTLTCSQSSVFSQAHF